MQQINYYLTTYHPYKPLLMYIKESGLSDRMYLQTAWNLINDSYYSDVCFQHPPHLIALAAIYMTGMSYGSPQSPSLSSGRSNMLQASNSNTPPSTSGTVDSRLKISLPFNISQKQPSSDEKIRKWFDQLNVHMKPIGQIVQQLVDTYQSLKTLEMDVAPILLRVRNWAKSGKWKPHVSNTNVISPSPMSPPNQTQPIPSPQTAIYNPHSSAPQVPLLPNISGRPLSYPTGFRKS